MAVKLKLTPEKGAEAEIAHAHTIHQQAQVVPWKLSTFEDCFTKPYYGVFAYENEQVIGYAIVLEVADEATLMDIAVDDAFRGQGVGRALVDYVLTASEQNGMIEMWLEVRESNLAAIKLYEKLLHHEKLRGQLIKDGEGKRQNNEMVKSRLLSSLSAALRSAFTYSASE